MEKTHVKELADAAHDDGHDDGADAANANIVIRLRIVPDAEIEGKPRMIRLLVDRIERDEHRE